MYFARIRYARVGNAQPVYTVEGIEDRGTELAGSVDEVAAILGRPLRSVRIACREAREDGLSEMFV